MEPPEDREMPLQEHLAELRKRLLRVFVVFVIGIAIVFRFSGQMIKDFWSYVLPDTQINVVTPTEWFMVQLTFSFSVVLIVVYPYLVYELYQFARPGLYEHERRFVKIFLPFSYILFLVGVSLGFFIVVPRVFSISMLFNMGADPFLTAKKTLYSALKIILAFGLSFQIPVLAVIAVRIGLIDSKWLKSKRWIVYLAVFILATNLTLDISGISQIIVLTLVVIMYEFSIVLARIMEKNIKSTG
ncbi:twin-arginine translocase subunit TatC [Archaeoglobus profundus]|uniref:Sec-independent protein translocase protein TatC n=1 Tax=Archaeoglobus profundus (strain DSM 5631 / JCM 9629 / NBRC 100127 / Av18) TaxID=572546 RepID=D2RFZ6_ARCPA|nr:twin-arginine translocase subunit TatC [Archaeoglobus profundus]ADB57221.1 Sec-independent protein translocase, TatC subunit [Archaeoglobus profundus DSM 5631]